MWPPTQEYNNYFSVKLNSDTTIWQPEPLHLKAKPSLVKPSLVGQTSWSKHHLRSNLTLDLIYPRYLCRHTVYVLILTQNGIVETTEAYSPPCEFHAFPVKSISSLPPLALSQVSWGMKKEKQKSRGGQISLSWSYRAGMNVRSGASPSWRLTQQDQSKGWSEARTRPCRSRWRTSCSCFEFLRDVKR